jgi:hypothetical protein
MTQSDMLSLAASVRRRAVQRTTLYRLPEDRLPEDLVAPHKPHAEPLFR